MIRYFSTILIGLLWTYAAAAQTIPTVPVVPIPEWVDTTALPRLAPELYRHTQDGKAYHVLERQVTFQNGRRLQFSRTMIEVVNRAGLESVASVVRDFDPEIETLALIRLDILRGAERISLAGKITPTLVRRETQLEAGIIDGTLTAHYDLPGLRVGDIVDAAFLYDSGSYLPGALGEWRMQMSYVVPVGIARTVMHWPKSFPPPRIKLSDPALLYSDSAEPGGRRFEWRSRGGVPLRLEDDTPWEFDPFDSVTITPHADWDAVAAAVRPHYTQAHPLPAAWRAQVDAIRAASPSPVQRAYDALYLVEDTIRYVGVEIGAGGYLARSPDEVVAQGFGDCKDKALLLKTVLADLGIEAEVALARLDGGRGLGDALPRTSAFDHMIVAAYLDGAWVYMDPTQGFAGGVGRTAVQPDLGWVLPISAGPDDLVLIDTDGQTKWSRDIFTTFTFLNSGVEVEVRTAFGGNAASSERRYWATNTVYDIAESFLRYYSQIYPGIRQAADPTMTDDRAANLVTVSERYLIPKAALDGTELQKAFPFKSEFDYSMLPDPPLTDRTQPYVVPHRVTETQVIRVVNAPIEFEAPAPEQVSGPAFTARFSGRDYVHGGMVLRWSYESRARVIAPEDYAQVARDTKAAQEFRHYEWNITAPKPPAENLLDRALKLLDDLGKMQPTP